MGTNVYEELSKALDKGDKDSAAAQAQRLIKSGVTPVEIFSDCIEPVLEGVGKKFSRLEIFLPEMILAAEAVKSVQQVLLPHMNTNTEFSSRGKIILATVSGDLHDIGKNIVKAMLEVNGFDIKDLGVDVSMTNIVNEAREYKTDIIALSALMLPSLPFIKDTIELSRTGENADHKFQIMIGGGPVTKKWADDHGSAYGNDAAEAVDTAKLLLKKIK